MRLARVVGTVVATVKDTTLEGKRLMLIQPIDRFGNDHGKPLLAVDSVGAGVRERVFYVRGKEASFPWHPMETPTDCSIVGILDGVNFEDEAR